MTTRRLLGTAGLLAALVLVTASLSASAAGAATPSASCSTTVKGAPWKIKQLGSGDTYQLKTLKVSCALAKTWTVKLSGETGTSAATFKGPAGFVCTTTASKLTGDSKLYDGICQKGKPATAEFIWAPKP